MYIMLKTDKSLSEANLPSIEDSWFGEDNDTYSCHKQNKLHIDKDKYQGSPS